MHRFFVDQSSFVADRFEIKDQRTAHQLANVLRMKKNEEIILLDNAGTEYHARIKDISKRNCTGEILTKTKKADSPKRNVILHQALLKKDNFELVLQKCTELGVFAFQPVITDRTIKVKTEVPERWHDIVREAAEQSGRIFIPEIREPHSLREAYKAASLEARAASFILHEKEKDRALISEVDRIGEGKTLNIFIGPEGGFSSDEVIQAEEYGVIPVGLGALVLRAETAAIVASALTLLA